MSKQQLNSEIIEEFPLKSSQEDQYHCFLFKNAFEFLHNTKKKQGTGRDKQNSHYLQVIWVYMDKFLKILNYSYNLIKMFRKITGYLLFKCNLVI